MVFTRQSINNAKPPDDFMLMDVPSQSNTSYVTQVSGRILQNGHFPSSDLMLPSTSTKNEVSIKNSLLFQQPRAKNLLDLPNEMLEKILSYLEYKSIAHIRSVCRQIDQICQAVLNSAFQRFQYKVLSHFQSIKAKMPRRESARRNHPLAYESEIIETVHMRLSLLQVTFGKHIERKSCCFFPGEVLDEVNRILNYIKVTSKLPKPYKVTDELFDLSSMAMKHFKENIEPSLPDIKNFGSLFNKGHKNPENGTIRIEAKPVNQSNIALRKRINKIKQKRKRCNDQLIGMRKNLRACKSQIAEQQKQLLKLSRRLNEYEIKNEETNRKLGMLFYELDNVETEMHYSRPKVCVCPHI